MLSNDSPLLPGESRLGAGRRGSGNPAATIKTAKLELVGSIIEAAVRAGVVITYQIR